jgi:methionyl-tRNA synthetase
MEKSLEEFRFREALQSMMQVARIGNKYLADMQPWNLSDTEQERRKTILNISLQLCARLAVISEPFMPFTSEKLKKMLRCGSLNWNSLRLNTLLPAGHTLDKPVMLFRKIEDREIELQIQKLNTSNPETFVKQENNKEEKIISYEAFSEMKMIIATILEAEKVPGADKLLRLTLDDGKEKRTVVSGIAQHYTPQEIIGKQVLLLANLAPRKLKGIESRGMILMAESDGKLIFVSPESNVKNGSVVK